MSSHKNRDLRAPGRPSPRGAVPASLAVRAVVLLAVLIPVGSDAALPADREDRRVLFNRDIRPLLAGNCFHCHGPDKKNRRARLRLDQEKGVRRVFPPRDFEEGEAWLRITSDDDDFRMPPPDSHRELKPAAIETLRSWIAQGAEWQGHWAFLPPRRSVVPAPVNGTGSPIDSFIRARLAKEGLAPSREADREDLIRRVTFDLTGLPPTLEEIDSFLADTRPDAYERVVDRLLASPHFGERMALAWLDAARYGDSSVFHADGPRDMWPWRDWVIEAYNRNKPFDEFTIEQLAGDLLPDASVEQRIATGFHRNNATTDEGGAIAEEFRVEYAVDRVKTTSLVWMALSMECAQCHDHKYEPISQEEYYGFFAYFNQASDPGMQTRAGNQAPVADVPNYARLPEVPALAERQSRLEESLEARTARAAPLFAAWLKRAAAEVESDPPMPRGILLHLPLDEAEGTLSRAAPPSEARAKIHGEARWADGKHGKAFECNGKNHLDAGDSAGFERTDAFSYGAWLKPHGKGQGAPIARMDDGDAHRGYDIHLAGGRVEMHLIHRWPENALKVKTTTELKPDVWQHVFVTYDGSSRGAGVKIYIDGQPQKLEVEQDRLNATTRTKKPLTFGRRTSGSPYKGWIDDVRVYSRHLSDTEVAVIAGADPLRPLLAMPAAERSPEQVALLRTHFLESEDEPYRRLALELREVKEQIAAASRPLSTVMVMQDVGTARPTYVLQRGNYASPLEERPVRPGVPAVLPPLASGAAANRLGMARWLLQPEHPLTARVAVNRYWHLLFGTGIVKTVEDFGSQGEWPSHPALLDWLAVEFVDSGWDIKGIIRRIVTSETYRQSSRARPGLLERDPENRLLARGPRFRLQGEFIRDNALAASRLLSRRLGGPSVKPYQPPGLWNEVSLSGNVRFVQDEGERLYRRSLYTYWKRSAPAPSLTIFDAPTREKCVLRRSRTNTPLQALVTLNDPQFVEAARALAARALHEGGETLEERLSHAFRLATARNPRPSTLRILAAAYREELRVFRESPERAARLLEVGDSAPDSHLDPAEQAAMAIVASLILNLDATLTRG